MKKVIAITLLLAAIGMAIWYVPPRIRAYEFFRPDPETLHRYSIVPTEMDLSGDLPRDLISYDVGYATFSLPGTKSIKPRAQKNQLVTTWPLGESFMTLMWTFDNKPPEFAALGLELSALDHLPELAHLFTADASALDFERTIQHTMPLTRWEALTFSTEELALAISLRGYKGLLRFGHRTVQTFSTDTINGMILAGEHTNDHHHALIMLENKSRTVGLNIRIETPDNGTPGWEDALPVFLQTFTFTTDEPLTHDEHIDINKRLGFPSFDDNIDAGE